jgi:hypothetical protein
MRLAHDGDAVGDGERLFLVVGDVHGGDAQVLLDLAQLRAQAQADLGVEGGQRLVEEQDLGLASEGAGQGHRCCWPPESWLA